MQQLRGHGDSEIESLLTQIIPLYLTYGVVFGAGATLTYTPSLAIIGHYFKRHIGLANGLVAAGSSVFSIVMPLVLQVLLDEIGVGQRIYQRWHGSQNRFQSWNRFSTPRTRTEPVQNRFQ